MLHHLIFSHRLMQLCLLFSLHFFFFLLCFYFGLFILLFIRFLVFLLFAVFNLLWFSSGECLRQHFFLSLKDPFGSFYILYFSPHYVHISCKYVRIPFVTYFSANSFIFLNYIFTLAAT